MALLAAGAVVAVLLALTPQMADTPLPVAPEPWTADHLDRECPLAFEAVFATLCDSAPEPLWFFPFVLSEPDPFGIVVPKTEIRICGTAHRSSWTERSLWLRVTIERAGGRGGFAQGWLTVGPRPLASFARAPTSEEHDRNRVGHKP